MNYSPFGKLSAELRNCIYEFAAPGNIDIMIEDTHHLARPPTFGSPTLAWPEDPEYIGPPPLFTGPPRLVAPQGSRQLLALSSTCRQMRHEALPVFLAENHIKIHAHIAIGSASTDDVKFIAHLVFDWYAAFGAFAYYLKNLEIFLGDSKDEDYELALPLRLSLIRELNILFRGTVVRPSITMEIQLPIGVTTSPWLRSYPTRFEFPPVPPARIDLVHWSILENERSIDQAIANAQRTAIQLGYATPGHMRMLEQRRSRAQLVLQTLSRSSRRA